MEVRDGDATALPVESSSVDIVISNGVLNLVPDKMDAIAEIRRVIAGSEPAGRRLDFLMQELNREANTLSSKSQDLETTRAAVDMKVLIEQLREQVQNIE